MTAIWVEITDTRGSTPRDVGTAMRVTAHGLEGTIGGGALEHQAISEARGLLARGGDGLLRSYPLGPDLGQCCGGAVTLHYTRQPRPVDPVGGVASEVAPISDRPEPLWIWGAGHVGRAVVRALPKQAFQTLWIDSAPERFPQDIPDHITTVPAADMPLLAARAPRAAHHLIFTYSHDIDLALCAALLRRGAAWVGVIGSATKKARFFKRLRVMGLDPTPIICPIGDRSLGKAPEAIAKGVVQQLLHPVGGTGE